MIADLLTNAGLVPLAIAACAVFAGTLIQRLAGQGLGLVASPILAIVLPAYLPATILLLGFVVGLSTVAMDFSHIAKKELIPGFLGRTIGALLAAWIASHIAGTNSLAIAIGITVLIAVALSIAGLRARITPQNLFIAGSTAGLMGTLTGIGAPPMAMLYQHEPAKRSRAMQNVFFGFGMIVSIGALMAFDLMTLAHLVIALTLVPAVVLGLITSNQLTGRFETHSIRPWALGLSTLAALALLAQNLT